jgi:hypothetical protein
MKTPETEDIARGNHVVPTEWAEQLERERDEARREIEILKGMAGRGIIVAANHASLDEILYISTGKQKERGK